ncbi:hypothetical protein M409DRAFT_27189 [Zasmidium cellare ATCC 36951]|uniref:Transcription factor domain-containing protein n=1 Tax=Zasmidium cellare ATCC 36951 TaxID=1080233 RepID=A0A6A6C5W9_ZASCE|nr:uncharacterized protein M409DRAFT_27189 [Zasmidium cellare ATCC 36951]KAF2162567.1 hypothetical protein M409DRAFT_27189 [Zasmidium cellare ATCC 36951]
MKWLSLAYSISGPEASQINEPSRDKTLSRPWTIPALRSLQTSQDQMCYSECGPLRCLRSVQTAFGTVQWAPGNVAENEFSPTGLDIQASGIFEIPIENDPLTISAWDTPAFQALLDDAGEEITQDAQADSTSPASHEAAENVISLVNTTHAQSTTVLGRSSEFDPFLRRFYNFDQHGRFSSHLRSFEMPGEGAGPLLMLTPFQTIKRSSKDLFPDRSQAILSELEPYHDRLLELFKRFVGSAYPAIDFAADFVRTPALLAVVYALALPWRSNDPSLPWVRFGKSAKNTAMSNPPDFESLLRFAWESICEEVHGPTMATLQACLLFMERKLPNAFVSQTIFDSTVANMALTVALSLGLNLDMCPLNLSSEQNRSRKMLWWLTHMQNVWTAAINGQHCLVTNVRNDVEILQDGDAEGQESSDSWLRMARFCELTCILEKILVLINGRLSDEQIPRVNELPTQLDAWMARVDKMSTNAFANTAELRVACAYCRILMSRFMLEEALHKAEFDPIYQHGLDIISAGILAEVERITLTESESFWFRWSRSYFSTAADYFILLQVLAPEQTTQKRAAAAGDQYRQWLWLHSKSHELTRMGLARYDTLMSAFENGQLRKMWT